MPQKVGKKMGIYFYQNVPSEINLPLKVRKAGKNTTHEKPVSGPKR